MSREGFHRPPELQRSHGLQIPRRLRLGIAHEADQNRVQRDEKDEEGNGQRQVVVHPPLQQDDEQRERESDGNLRQEAGIDDRRPTRRRKRQIAADDDLDAAGHEQEARGREEAADHGERNEPQPLTELQSAKPEQQRAGQKRADRDGDHHVDDHRFGVGALGGESSRHRGRQHAHDGDCRRVRAGIGGNERRGQRHDHARDHRAHDERGQPQRKSRRDGALEDQRAERNAVRDIDDRRDRPRQSVTPKR